jgi:predicted dehydrogenase
MPELLEKQINWGIIGYGNIAKKFHENIKKISHNKLCAISTKNIKYLEDLIVYDNELELLKNKKVNSIYISNINTQHYFSAINCLKNKKNIYTQVTF